MVAGNQTSVVPDDFWSKKLSSGSLSTFDPLIYFRTILQFKWPILLATALVTALSVVYVIGAEPLYRSTQSLLLESTESNIVPFEDLIKDAPEDAGYVQTRMEILKSRDLAKRVLNSLNLLSEPIFLRDAAKHAGIDISQLSHDPNSQSVNTINQTEPSPPGNSDVDKESIAINFYLSRLHVEQVPTTRLVRISYMSADRELAAKIANEAGLQYIRSYVESNQLKIDEMTSWLDTKLEELKLTLDESENRLLVFKNENELFDVNGSVSGISEQELMQSTVELTEARVRLSDTGIVLDKLRNVSTPEEILNILPASLIDPLVSNTRLEINRVSTEIDQLAIKYGPQHPRMIQLDSELDSLQSDLTLSLQEAIEAARNENSVAQQKVDLIESRLQFDRQAVQQVGAQSVQLQALEADVQTNRDLYYRFLDRMIETRSTRGLESANATVAEFATPSLGPAKPNKTLIVLLSFIGTLLASMLAALIAGALDDSIKHPSDVEQKLSERLMGVIPLYSANRGRLARYLPGGKAAKEKQGRIFFEAYTTVRTNLSLERKYSPGKIVLLTSSVPGEGKSMSSVCLARSFAQMENVLLIDADIRRPSLSTALKIDKQLPGLTNYILGQCSLDQCIQRHNKSRINVLCSGPVTNHPLEMLSSGQLAQALEDLATRYDRIFIDSAPVEAVSDALVLSKLADRVIYVAKSHDTSVKLVNNGLEKLRGVGAPIVGVLLTQVDLTKLTTYGADYGFRDYSDHYGYAMASDDYMPDLTHEQLKHIRTRKKSKLSQFQAEHVA